MSSGSLELNLPDLPEVPIRLGSDAAAPAPGTPRPVRLPWPVRVRDALTAYLPLLLMVALALGTWWLVKNSPQPLQPRAPKVASAEPDYTLRGFTVQRFAADGQLQLTLVGRQLHHYPIDDRVEIEELRLTADSPGRPRTVATARRALTDGKATEVRLLGGAQVRGSLADGRTVEIDSEFLHYFAQSQRVVTDQPVLLRVGTSVVRAGGLVWDHPQRVLELKPPMQAVLQLSKGIPP